MLHQSSTEIIGAGSCWLFLLLGWAGWAAAVNNTLPATAQETYLQNLTGPVCETSYHKVPGDRGHFKGRKYTDTRLRGNSCAFLGVTIFEQAQQPPRQLAVRFWSQAAASMYHMYSNIQHQCSSAGIRDVHDTTKHHVVGLTWYYTLFVD
jgi:hypothetical protein